MKKLTIDPGVNGTGYAVWDGNWTLMENGVILSDWYNEVEDPLEKWTLRALAISLEVKSIAKTHGVRELIIEYPSNFGGGGVAVSTDATIKIGALAGMIAGMSDVNKIEFLPVNKWKGQLPKRVVEKRIKRLLSGVQAKSHDFDAIGMGLHKAGRF